MLSEAIVGIGSNMGDKISNVDNAIKALANLKGINVERVSNYYETIPFNVPDKQENYINCCVRLSTVYTVRVLLGICLGIESAMGRERKYRFCPRVIDIDVLAYGKERINDDELIVPHPRIKERAFVMIPMNDVCADKKFGVLDFSEEFKAIDKSGIRMISENKL